MNNKIKPGTRSKEHFEQAEKVFLDNMDALDSEKKELYKKLYESLTPKLKQFLQVDLIDYDLALVAIRDTPPTDPNRLRDIVDKDFDKRMKKLNIGKYTSNKCRELLIGRVLIVKIVDYKTILYMPTITRQGLYIHLMELAEYKSAIGSIYVLTSGAGKSSNRVFVVHSHLFERYNQRSGNAEGFGDAQKWLFAELITSASALDDDDLTMEGRICRGRVFPRLKMVIPSGILLGSSYLIGQDAIDMVPSLPLGGRIVYLKTYVSLDMLTKEQDEEHREAWDEIFASLSPLEKKVINSSR
jgi:hypothetical protein